MSLKFSLVIVTSLLVASFVNSQQNKIVEPPSRDAFKATFAVLGRETDLGLKNKPLDSEKIRSLELTFQMTYSYYSQIYDTVGVKKWSQYFENVRSMNPTIFDVQRFDFGYQGFASIQDVIPKDSMNVQYNSQQIQMFFNNLTQDQQILIYKSSMNKQFWNCSTFPTVPPTLMPSSSKEK